SFSARGPRSGEAAAFKRCLGITPRQNREQLLLRDGVRRGRNAGKTHQTLRSAGRKTGAGNCNAGGCWIGRSSRAEPCPPRYQANKHHGEVEGGTRCNGEDYRPRLGENARRIGFLSGDFIARGICRNTRVCESRAFGGVGVDIRSDLYSLGVTLWVMVTGQTPFRGPSAEVMYQHQHAPLPRERLKDVPQPVVVLLEKLLEKDPAQRFQTPNEVLKAMPTITGAIDARRRITPQSLLKMPPTATRVATREPRIRPAPKKISIARLPVTGCD